MLIAVTSFPYLLYAVHSSIIRSTSVLSILGTRKKDVFFGRKFEPMVSQEIIDRVDEELIGLLEEEAEAARSCYWENVYHFKDQSPKARPELTSFAEATAKMHLEEIREARKSDFR